jgi:RHS repeat-associated protein
MSVKHHMNALKYYSTKVNPVILAVIKNCAEAGFFRLFSWITMPQLGYKGRVDINIQAQAFLKHSGGHFMSGIFGKNTFESRDKLFVPLSMATVFRALIVLVVICAGLSFSDPASAQCQPPQGGPSSGSEGPFSLGGFAGTTYAIDASGGDPFYDAISTGTMSTSGGASFSMTFGGCSPVTNSVIGFYTTKTDTDSRISTFTDGYGGAAVVTPGNVFPSPKNLGTSDPGCPSGCEGNPINTATGDKYQVETDYVGGTNTHIELRRYYNSLAMQPTGFGMDWRSTYDRSILTFPGSNLAQTYREDGRIDSFWFQGGVWVGDADVTTTLAAVMTGGVQTGWQVTRGDDSVELYNISGQLTSITTREGLTTTLTYNGTQLATVTGPFGHTLQYSYYTTGNVYQIKTPDGLFYTYAYDANNNLTSVTYPDKTVRQYRYENTSFPNALTGIIDELNNRYATYGYDTSGRANLSEHAGGAEATTIQYTSNFFGITSALVTDPRNYTHTYNFMTQFATVKPSTITGAPIPNDAGQAFGYDANGFINSLTDWNNNITNYQHDTRGNLTQEVDAVNTNLQRTINITPEPNFHLPHIVYEPNRTTTLTHNANGSLQSKVVVSANDGTADSGTRTWSYTYYPSKLLNTIVGPRTDINQVTIFTYDNSGDVASIQDAAGHLTKIPTYDANGRPKKIIDPNGLVTLLGYDPRGRLTSRTSGAEKTSYKYDKAGNLIQVTQPDGSYLKYTYDMAHRLTKITDAFGDSITYTLDLADNRTKQVIKDPNGTLTRTRSFMYDQVNHLQEEIGAKTQTTIYGYDLQGNLTGIQDPNKNITMYTPDALNRLAGMMDPYKNITAYGYDANDHLTGVQDPRTLVTTYNVDGLNNTASTLSPDSGATNRTFDAAGNILTSTDANGHTTQYNYDALNRTKTITYADGQSIALTYDTGTYGIGHLTQMNDPAGATTWSYDINGHVIGKQQVTTPVTLMVAYPTATNGQQTGITYPSGKALTYSFDTAQRISGISIGTQSIISNVTYDPFGVPKAWVQGNGATYTRTIDTDGRIAGVTLGSTASNPNIVTLAYTFDATNNIKSLAETGQTTKYFFYDKLNRLQQLTMGTGKTAPSVLYGYDANGNRNVLETLKGSTVIGTTIYNIAPTSNELNSLTGAQTQDNSYDSDGNLKSDGTNVFTYNARERVATVTNNKVTTTYGINGLGQRIVKTGTGVVSGQNEYAYDEAGHLLGEYDVNGVAIEETVWLGDTPVAMLQGTGGTAGVFYIAADNINAPHIITDQNGTQVWFWDHLAFGDNTPSLQQLTYNPRFPGQLFDQESGLNDNINRTYNASLGRYIQADPIGLSGGQASLYPYVGSNTLTRVDPKGEIWPEAIGMTLISVGIFEWMAENYEFFSNLPPTSNTKPFTFSSVGSGNVCNFNNTTGIASPYYGTSVDVPPENVAKMR